MCRLRKLKELWMKLKTWRTNMNEILKYIENWTYDEYIKNEWQLEQKLAPKIVKRWREYAKHRDGYKYTFNTFAMNYISNTQKHIFNDYYVQIQVMQVRAKHPYSSSWAGTSKYFYSHCFDWEKGTICAELLMKIAEDRM
jgi:hypothetical protein